MERKTVMVVDNDKDFLNELGELLETSGYNMVTFDDPLSTLEAADKTSADVILMDLQMPGKTGIELANELKIYPRFRSVPVILMTGHYRKDVEPLMQRSGITKCLKKPFMPLDVIAGIETVSDNIFTVGSSHA